ncbi:MAG: hypothetical protein HY951_17665 [Bacteroidia bacterium]|nr:hypothetical protein [Bacteroidia bacterium]
MFYKISILLLVSSVKFIFAFPLALGYKFSFIETLSYTSLGGMLGVIFFAFISDELIIFYNWFVHVYMHNHPKSRSFGKSIKDGYRKIFPKKEKKIFSKKSKRFVRIKQSWGLAGISILTPLILSIPIGTFLTIRFFKRSKKTILILCSSVLFWSLFFSSILHFTTIRF